MNNSLQKQVNSFARAHTALVTSYVLITPAATKSVMTYCGFEEHEHTDECCEETRILVCELEKVNTSPIVSASDEDITFTDLEYGHYYLVETAAPGGYYRLPAPVPFDYLVSGSIICDDENAIVDTESGLLFCVKNKSGYRLPETGGFSSSTVYALGFLLCAGAIMYGCISRRKQRERRMY